jgi:hypothetical protein
MPIKVTFFSYSDTSIIYQFLINKNKNLLFKNLPIFTKNMKSLDPDGPKSSVFYQKGRLIYYLEARWNSKIFFTATFVVLWKKYSNTSQIKLLYLWTNLILLHFKTFMKGKKVTFYNILDYNGMTFMKEDIKSMNYLFN